MLVPLAPELPTPEKLEDSDSPGSRLVYVAGRIGILDQIAAERWRKLGIKARVEDDEEEPAPNPIAYTIFCSCGKGFFKYHGLVAHVRLVKDRSCHNIPSQINKPATNG